MPRQKKEIAIWTVRNTKGQFLGTFYAYTAQEAINKLVASDRSTASTFRKSQPASIKASDCVAAVEPRS